MQVFHPGHQKPLYQIIGLIGMTINRKASAQHIFLICEYKPDSQGNLKSGWTLLQETSFLYMDMDMNREQILWFLDHNHTFI